jgi:pimeloyl-ACP methyl ester carboxylesterase
VIGRSFEVASDDGTHFSVADEGEGRPVLIVHPGGGTSEAWALVARRLTARFRVLRFDRRPYRPSGGGAPMESMAGEVADVLAVASAVRERLLLVGHSSGAVVALEAAVASPAAFAGLVLYEPPVAVSSPLCGDALRRAREAIASGEPGRAMTIHLREIVRMPGYQVVLLRLFVPLWDRMKKVAASQIADDAEIESLGVGIDRYRDLIVPTLLVGGARSPRHLRMRLDSLREVLPRLDAVVILKRQGHIANIRAPWKLAAIIERFATATLG